MEKENTDLDYGVENWQKLRDIINASDEGLERFRKLLGVGRTRFCFVQDYKQNLYIILAEDREDFLKMLRIIEDIKKTSIDEIEDKNWYFHPHGINTYNNCIGFKRTDALKQAQKYLETRWGTFRVVGSPFDYTFMGTKYISDKNKK